MTYKSYLIAAAIVFTGSLAQAHTVWLEPAQTSGDYKVMFGGHAGKVESYKPEKLKTVTAMDAQGKDLKVTRTVTPDGVRVHVDGAPAIIAMHFENGIFSNTGTGPTIEKPMDEVPGAKSATNAVKYHKTIVAWSPMVMKPLNQPFEIIPLDAAAPMAGKAMRVRVVQDGKPVAGVKLGRGEEGKAEDPVTDADGVGSFVPVKGMNHLWAGKRNEVSGNPKFTSLSYEYALGFSAQ